MEATLMITNKQPRIDRETLFMELYMEAFPLTAGFISKMGGSLDDAKDLFHDALVIYYEKSQQPLFTKPVSAEAYILGIVKHLWMRKFRRHGYDLSLTEAERSISVPEDYYPSINDAKLLRYLEKSGEKCLNLLRAFYYDNLPMKKIATAFGYATDRSATVQKYKCLEKVRDTIKDKSLGYEDFLE